MEERNLSDLEKMNAERKKAEAEYAEQREQMLDVKKIMREGVQDFDDLVKYLVAAIQDCKHMEDLGRMGNNNIMYSEAVGIRRELTKLLKLVLLEPEEEVENVDGTEEKHRANNDGNEGYQ